jgi:hypothetical protein
MIIERDAPDRLRVQTRMPADRRTTARCSAAPRCTGRARNAPATREVAGSPGAVSEGLPGVPLNVNVPSGRRMGSSGLKQGWLDRNTAAKRLGIHKSRFSVIATWLGLSVREVKVPGQGGKPVRFFDPADIDALLRLRKLTQMHGIRLAIERIEQAIADRAVNTECVP